MREADAVALVGVEPRRFVGNACDRAGPEHDALGLDVVDERWEHARGLAWRIVNVE